jgi:hypothetical protein
MRRWAPAPAHDRPLMSVNQKHQDLEMSGAAIQVVNPGSAARRLLVLILSSTLLPA